MTQEKKKDVKFLLIFIAVISISLIYLFQASYAKYRKQIQGNVDVDLASWKIKINDEDISNKSELENKLTPTFDANDYVKENVLAPGSTGYVELKIDSSEIDVNFAYEITTSLSDETNLTDLKVLNYQINDEEKTTMPEIITQVVAHNTPLTTIKLFIAWDDESEGTMNNQEDTAIATNPLSKAEINVNIKFYQKNN